MLSLASNSTAIGTNPLSYSVLVCNIEKYCIAYFSQRILYKIVKITKLSLTTMLTQTMFTRQYMLDIMIIGRAR